MTRLVRSEVGVRVVGAAIGLIGVAVLSAADAGAARAAVERLHAARARDCGDDRSLRRRPYLRHRVGCGRHTLFPFLHGALPVVAHLKPQRHRVHGRAGRRGRLRPSVSGCRDFGARRGRGGRRVVSAGRDHGDVRPRPMRVRDHRHADAGRASVSTRRRLAMRPTGPKPSSCFPWAVSFCRSSDGNGTAIGSYSRRIGRCGSSRLERRIAISIAEELGLTFATQPTAAD